MNLDNQIRLYINSIFLNQIHKNNESIIYFRFVGMNIEDFSNEIVATNYTIFHRYWICQEQLIPTSTQIIDHGHLSFENDTSHSTLYKCRIISQNTVDNYQNYYVMKVVPYIKDLPKIGRQLKQIHSQIRNYRQIQSEYTALSILKKCARVSKLKELIYENEKREDDRQFFYSFLKKTKCLKQRYFCIITQYCNQGNIDNLLKNKKYQLKESEIIYYASQILLGLRELRQKKIIHRNLQLNNILVHNNEIKFSDFYSCFISGKSNWKDIKNGINLEKSPPQIIELASKSDEELQKLDSQQLYLRQQKSDIYFFGLVLFKLIYGYNYDKFRKKTLSNLVAEKVGSCKFNENLLDILIGCLEEKVENRIDFGNLYKQFAEIEKYKYFSQSSVEHLYLSEQPICFGAITNYNTYTLALTRSQNVEQQNNPQSQYQQNFEEYFSKAANNRMTSIYKDTFLGKNSHEMEGLWRQVDDKMRQYKILRGIIQNFIRVVSTHSFYYEFLYKSILCINDKNIKNHQDVLDVRKTKNKLEEQLTIFLSFLFKLLFKTPFIRDRRYNANDLSYETMKLFENIIKSDVIQNKMYCYEGKQRRMKRGYEEQIKKIIKEFFNIRYQNQSNFQPIYENIMKVIQDIRDKLKKMLKNTIINLRVAYENIKGKQKNTSNIKEILFILITLEQINLKIIKKKQLIVIWNCLVPFLNEQIQLDTNQAEMIFSEYKRIYVEEQSKISHPNNIDSLKNIISNENEKYIQQQDNQEKPDKQCEKKQKPQNGYHIKMGLNQSNKKQRTQKQQKQKI